MYKVLLWDLDGTIIDSHKSVENSLLYCFKKLNIYDKYDLDKVKVYYDININYWRNLGIKYKTIDEILKLRFVDFFAKYNIDKDPIVASNYYEEEASRTMFPIGNTIEIIKDLKKYFKMYIATNGKSYVQNKKIDNCGIKNLFNGVFISEDIGYNKPDKRYFEKILSSIGSYNKDEILMIGDTLDSDIKGANNIGIKCCWFNPLNQKPYKDLKIDYIIKDSNELYDILNIKIIKK